MENCLKNGFVANGHVRTGKVMNGLTKLSNGIKGQNGLNGLKAHNHVSFQLWLFLIRQKKFSLGGSTFWGKTLRLHSALHQFKYLEFLIMWVVFVYWELRLAYMLFLMSSNALHVFIEIHQIFRLKNYLKKNCKIFQNFPLNFPRKL